MINRIKSKITQQLQDKNFGEVLKGSAVTLIAMIVAVIFALVNNLIIGRVYGAEELGVYSTINSFLIIMVMFSLIGSDISILRFIPEHLSKYSLSSAFSVYKKLLIMVVSTAIILGIVVYSASGFIADDIYKKEYLTTLFLLTSPFILFYAVNNFNIASLRALKEIKLFALFQVLNPLFIFVVLISLTLIDKQQYNSVYSLFASTLLLASTSSYFIWKIYKRSNNEQKATVADTRYKTLLGISLPMFLTAAMQVVIAQTGIIMLGMFATMSDVGIYSVSVKLASLTVFTLMPINAIIAPKFSELFHSGDHTELKKIAQKSSKLIFWSIAPFVTVLLIFGVEILGLFGESFHLGYTAMIIVIVGQSINALTGSVGYLLNMTGNQKTYNYIVIAGAILNILVNLILIPKYGLNGAAFASMTSMIFINITASIYSKKKLGFFIGYIPILSDIQHYKEKK
jgi:O-antigen/teichoic acid export membrane protein